MGGTHPHVQTVVASHNWLTEFSTQGFCGSDGTGSLQILNLECNCLTGSNALDIKGAGGNNLYSIRLRGNWLDHLDMTDVGKYQRWSMNRLGTHPVNQPTGSLYELDLSQNKLKDPKMFTSSYIANLMYMDIQGNAFEHFPLDDWYGGWDDSTLQLKKPAPVVLNAYNYAKAQYDDTDRIYYRTLPHYCANENEQKNRLWDYVSVRYHHELIGGPKPTGSEGPLYYGMSHGFASVATGAVDGQTTYAIDNYPRLMWDNPLQGTITGPTGIQGTYYATNSAGDSMVAMDTREFIRKRIYSGEDGHLFNPLIYRNECNFYSDDHQKFIDRGFWKLNDWGESWYTEPKSIHGPSYGKFRPGQRNNFSSSFVIQYDWAKNLMHLNVSNCSITGSVTIVEAPELMTFIAAANRIEALDMTPSTLYQNNSGEDMSKLRAIVAPCQGKPSHSAGYQYEYISSGSNYFGTNPVYTSSFTASVALRPQTDPMGRYGNKLTQITMSGKNTGDFEYPYLNHINLEKNISLGYIDLRGINLNNWSARINYFESLYDNWPPNNTSDAQNFPTLKVDSDLDDVNQNAFNFYQCGSLAQSGSGELAKMFKIRVRNAASKSLIDTYRGTTKNFPFRMNTWATVSYW